VGKRVLRHESVGLIGRVQRIVSVGRVAVGGEAGKGGEDDLVGEERPGERLRNRASRERVVENAESSSRTFLALHGQNTEVRQSLHP
jgi:hypothetical protein